MAEMMKRGGGGFVFEGELASLPRESKPNKDTGEVSVYAEVLWFGGSVSLKMASPEQAKLLRAGMWVRFTAPAKKFQENTYAGPATLTHINEKAVDAKGAA